MWTQLKMLKVVMAICILFFSVSCSGNPLKKTMTPSLPSQAVEATQTVVRVEETMQGKIVQIQANTQLTYEDLKIGTGNFWEEEYTNDKNEKLTGVTAGLWIYVKGKPQEDLTLRVYPGEKISVSGYKLNVVAISQSEGQDIIELVIGK